MKNSKTISVILLAFIVLFAGGFYIAGFRLTGDMKVVRAGSIEVVCLSSGAEIFIDNAKKKRIAPNEDGAVFLNISPGPHSILVAMPKFWPWSKEFEISPSEREVFIPFFAPEEPSGFIIKENDPEYASLRLALSSLGSPSVFNKRISKSGRVAVWNEGSVVYAEWLGVLSNAPSPFCPPASPSGGSVQEDLPAGGNCGKIRPVFESAQTIKNLDFFRDRDDVLVLGTETGIFALELDGAGTRNFQPIYRGANLNFLARESDVLYILDGENLLEIKY